MYKKLAATGFPILLTVFFLGASIVGYAGLAYYAHIDHPKQLAIFLALVFLGYGFWWFNRSLFSWRTLLIFAVLFRLIFMFDSQCRLSNDVFRFIWDAEQVSYGENPYDYTPAEWSTLNPQTIFDSNGALYEHLEYKNAHSTYPPVNQYLWANGAWLARMMGYGDSIQARVFILKWIYLIIEIITMLLLVKILLKRSLAGQLAGIYALNPLVIVEFSGNLHPEAIMILFLVIAAILALSQRFILAAIPFGFAISTKFIPLLFLPFLVKKYGWKKTISFSLVALLVVALLFLPFLSNQLITNVSDSFYHFIENVEFNASVYFLVKYFAVDTLHFIPLQDLGFILLMATVAGIVILWWRYKKSTQAMLWIYVIYILLATSVQPWYLAITLVLAILTNRRWPLVASGAVMLSYFLYTFGLENKWILIIEYTIIVSAMLFDYWYSKKHVENHA